MRIAKVVCVTKKLLPMNEEKDIILHSSAKTKNAQNNQSLMYSCYLRN
jgi:hypothetical protein